MITADNAVSLPAGSADRSTSKYTVAVGVADDGVAGVCGAGAGSTAAGGGTSSIGRSRRPNSDDSSHNSTSAIRSGSSQRQMEDRRSGTGGGGAYAPRSRVGPAR